MGQGSIASAEVIIGVHGRLTKENGKDIDLWVLSIHLGNPSPYIVLTDGVSSSGIIGGNVTSLDQIFDEQVAEHEGYRVEERRNLVQA